MGSHQAAEEVGSSVAVVGDIPAELEGRHQVAAVEEGNHRESQVGLEGSQAGRADTLAGVHRIRVVLGDNQAEREGRHQVEVHRTLAALRDIPAGLEDSLAEGDKPFALLFFFASFNKVQKL